MGNRAYVVFTEKQGDRQRFSPAVYLHWNGGPESIYQFLAELDRRGCRGDMSYRSARFCQVVADYFGDDGLSLGVANGPRNLTRAEIKHFASEDNGLYVVGRDTMRRFKATGELTTEQVASEKAAALAEKAYADPDKGMPADFGRLAAAKDAAKADDDGAGDDGQTEAEAEAEKTEAAEAARAMTGAVMTGAFLQV
jgi:hypothetical protein